MSLIIIMSGELQIIMTKRDCLNFATSINMNSAKTMVKTNIGNSTLRNFLPEYFAEVWPASED